jgi:hypothetical protein
VKPAALVVGLATCGVVSACRGSEGERIAGAVETFVEFGMSNEERPLPPSSQQTRPHAHERSRSIDSRRRVGPVLRVELDLAHDLDGPQVEATLSSELDRLLAEGNARVEARGLPSGLLRYAGVMGVARGSLAPDGGATGTVESWVDDRARPLTTAEHEALVALELALARAGPGKAAAEAKRRVEEVHGAATVRAAIAAARNRFPRRP